MEEKEEKPKVLTSSPVSEEDKSWHEHRRKTEQETPQRLEDAAKFIGSAQALSLSLLIGLLENQQDGVPLHFLLTGSLVAWLISVLLSLMVVFPLPWQLDAQSAESIKAAHAGMVRQKYGLLVVSAVLFIGALVMSVMSLVG